VASDSEYKVGQSIRITASFTVDGTLTDPDTVTIKLRHGSSGEITTLVPQTETTGIYYVDVDTTGFERGDWNYRVEGTGATQAAAESTFTLTSRFT
jgi:hypothetical protein